MNNSLSSFLFDLRADTIGSLDVDHISIIHDAPRSPSTSLINMNRRAMGMDDFHQPIFLKEERKEKNHWEEEGLDDRNDDRSCLTSPAKQSSRRPGLGSRQCSDSVLLKPRRQPPSLDSPTKMLPNEGIGAGRTTSLANMHRWTSSSPSPQANTEATSKKDLRTFMIRCLSDSSLVMPTRCPITPPKRKAASS
jgi:hypothetical protein